MKSCLAPESGVIWNLICQFRCARENATASTNDSLPNGFADRRAGHSCIWDKLGWKLCRRERLEVVSDSKAASCLMAEEEGFEPPRPFRV